MVLIRLAVIGTFFRREENSFPLLHRLLVDSTYKPDEIWLMCETEDDERALRRGLYELYDLELIDSVHPENVRLIHHPTPMVGGSYLEIPYSRKINYALDRTEAEAIVYLDNNSIPAPEKYEVMLDGMKVRGAVYCTQERTGFNEETSYAVEVVPDAFCRLNYTQVMHRPTLDRWDLDMQYANPDLADARFWRKLHVSLGSFYPVGGTTVLDWHYMASPVAAGLE